MNNKKIGKAAILLSAVLALTACGGGSSEKNKDADNGSSGKTAYEQVLEKYPAIIENEGTPVDANLLKVALISDSGFKGVFNGFLCQDAIDQDILGITMNGAFPINEKLQFKMNDDNTPIKISIDKDKKIVNFKINPKFKWSNGDNVSSEDIVKTYEIVANQKYIVAAKSPRFGSQMKIVKGITEYNEGKADKISGLEIVSPSELNIHLTEITPAVYWGACFPSEFINAKQYKDVPMDKIQESSPMRKDPLSYGPYVIKSVVSGEKVLFEANPYYYKGEPKVKKLQIEIVPTGQSVAAVKAGKYDIAFGFKSDVFPQVEKLNNVKITSKLESYMSYIGFKLGKFDAKKNLVITNPKAKMNDVNLRKAIGYAIDNDALGKKYYSGLAFRAKGPLNPILSMLENPEVKGYPLDLEKANKLLDEAGYKDVDGDKIREDKNGKPFVINFAMMSGSDIQEPISKYYMQQWKKIGLNVKLVDGRLLEFHNFYERIQDDDPGIDMFAAAWALGSDPNPIETYGAHEAFNLCRYTTPELQKSLEALSSKASLNDKVLIKNYQNFDKVFFDEAPAIPMMNRVSYTAVNNRVKKYENYNYNKTDFDFSKIELVKKNPVADN